MKKKHTSHDTQTHPKTCDVCDKQFENSYEIKRHMFTHACHEAKFKCNFCEYGGQNEERMDVHIGRNHSDKPECCLC